MLRRLRHIWKTISYWGVNPDMSYTVQRQVILCNRFAVLAAFWIMLGASVQAILLQLYFKSVLFSFVNVMFAIVLLLNYRNKHIAARLLMVIGIPISLTVVNLLYEQHSPITAIQFITPRFTLAVTVVFSLMLFNNTTEKLYFRIGIFLNFLLLAGYDVIHKIFVVQYGLVFESTTDGGYYTAVSVIFWGVLVSSVVFLKNISTLFEKRTAETMDEIEQQNEMLTLQNKEIIRQKELIERQHHRLHNKNEQIQQSIAAAQTIQNAMLPSIEEFKNAFADFFLIFRPRDIVSGDFYWIQRHDNKVIVVIADCTGHGVPGAFMSMLGISLLNKIIVAEKQTHAGDILSLLSKDITHNLHQVHSGNRDGMEAIVLTFDYAADGKIEQLSFSGAKLDLYLVRSAQHDIEIIKGERHSVGGEKQSNHFVTHNIPLNKGAILYLGTDGFADQNNAERHRLGNERLLQLLQINKDLSLIDQKTIIENTLDSYMEGTSQRDDILFMAIKL